MRPLLHRAESVLDCSDAYRLFPLLRYGVSYVDPTHAADCVINPDLDAIFSLIIISAGVSEQIKWRSREDEPGNEANLQKPDGLLLDLTGVSRDAL